jgi:signal peptidase I
MAPKGKNLFREYFEAFAVALLAALILRALVIQAFRIPTGSMKDTLLVGDFLLVNKFIYGASTPDQIPFTSINLPAVHFPGLRQPKRGDIIVFKYPLDEKLDYIKRCVGVPGDTIEIRNGSVYINNKPEGPMQFIDKKFDQSEGHYINYYRIINQNGVPYTIRHYADMNPRMRDFGPFVVPPEHLFMMGDNRDNSQDSRYWGAVPVKNIRGQALVIYWSWEKNEPLWDLLHKIRWERIFSIIK